MSDMVSEVSEPVIRTFATGATRNLDVNKLDFEGFLCPMVLESFARYMNSHRLQKDGTLRSSDNWQAGIPLDVYMKSMWRHFFDVWSIHRGHKAFSSEDGHQITMEEALNAVAFNVNGYMHELLKAEAAEREDLEESDDECECDEYGCPCDEWCEDCDPSDAIQNSDTEQCLLAAAMVVCGGVIATGLLVILVRMLSSVLN